MYIYTDATVSAHHAESVRISSGRVFMSFVIQRVGPIGMGNCVGPSGLWDMGSENNCAREDDGCGRN